MAFRSGGSQYPKIPGLRSLAVKFVTVGIEAWNPSVENLVGARVYIRMYIRYKLCTVICIFAIQIYT